LSLFFTNDTRTCFSVLLHLGSSSLIVDRADLQVRSHCSPPFFRVNDFGCSLCNLQDGYGPNTVSAKPPPAAASFSSRTPQAPFTISRFAGGTIHALFGPRFLRQAWTSLVSNLRETNSPFFEISRNLLTAKFCAHVIAQFFDL